MTNDIIERMASKIDPKAFYRNAPPDTYLKTRQKQARDRVRNALKEIRQPTQEMLKRAALTDSIRLIDEHLSLAEFNGMPLPEFEQSPLLQIWQAMVDAALEEEKIDEPA